MTLEQEQELFRDMRSGDLYNDANPALKMLQQECCRKLEQWNRLGLDERERRRQLLKDMCASCGKGCWIEPPLYSNWGCHQLHLGNNVYFNFGCKLVDDGDIYIEDNVLVGPGVILDSGSHPVQPDLRRAGLQYTAPIRLCENAWIGAGAIILPGVTVGKNSVIGAGSVVNRDIPDNVVAGGNPCRVIRPLSKKDNQVFYANRSIDWQRMDADYHIEKRWMPEEDEQ